MIELIPAIDIIDGRCVRLTKGDYATERVYSEQPVDMAKAFEDFGFRRLHVVDLDGARSSHIVNHRVVEQIVAQTGLQVDFGGGVKTDEDVQRAFDFGARWVTVGCLAVTREVGRQELLAAAPLVDFDPTTSDPEQLALFARHLYDKIQNPSQEDSEEDISKRKQMFAAVRARQMKGEYDAQQRAAAPPPAPAPAKKKHDWFHQKKK